MPISTHNYAGFCALHSDNMGQLKGNHWGEAVTLLSTPSGLPYAFNFHQTGSDRGHTLILGTTGSGKTFFITFLLNMAVKLGVKIFYFDKDRGAEIAMRCLGADHAMLGDGQSTGFNPLQLGDSPENRRFLQSWLVNILSIHAQALTHEELDLIANAIRHNYESLTNTERTLANLSLWFGQKGPGTLRARFDAWHSEGALKEFFGSDQDALKLTNRFFHFEMGKMLSDDSLISSAVAPVLSYLFHRIELAIDGEPTLLVLDEAWKLLSNPQFESQLEDWLRTLRKRNVVVVLLTQDISEIQNTKIGSVIRSMTATKIIFPDVDMDVKSYQNYFDLSKRETVLLQSYAGNPKRYFLIKKPNESVITKLNSDGIVKWSPILSASESVLRAFDSLLMERSLSGIELAHSLLDKLDKKKADEE